MILYINPKKLILYFCYSPLSLLIQYKGGNRFEAFILANFPYTAAIPLANNEPIKLYNTDAALTPYGRKPKNHPWAASGCSSNQSHLATKWPFSFSSNYVSARLHAVNIKESDRWREIKELIALQAPAFAVRFFWCKGKRVCDGELSFNAHQSNIYCAAQRSALLATTHIFALFYILFNIAF